MRPTSISQFALVTLVGIGSVGLVSSFGQIDVTRAQNAAPTAMAILRTAAGDEVGRATFTGEDGKVALTVSANSLPAGFHGFHVHANGLCEAPDFTSAGPHFNVEGMTMQVGHSGDLPSLLANDDGTAQLSTVTDRFTVDDLLAGAGTALIIHAGRDNFANIPTRYAPAPDATTLATGDAGPRLACGVIQPADGSADADQARPGST
jgi:Cu-Zn family superoxide dismutase